MKRQPAAALLLTLLVACVACVASQRERTIRASLITVNELRDAFVTLDGKLQLAIVDTAKTREEGSARLAAYRTRRDELVEAFELAYRSIAIAATVDDGTKSLAAALEAMRRVESLVNKLKETSP